MSTPAILAALFIAAWAQFLPAADDLALTVDDLRCEYRINPLGIDVVNPRLSWILKAGRPGQCVRGQRQTAYQILVASSADTLGRNVGDLWDSGKVESDQSSQVVYSGKTMSSRERCHWKVRVWDKDGKVSGWSEPSFWSMGLLQPDDWKAIWIGYDEASKQSPKAHDLAQRLKITGKDMHWVRMPPHGARIGNDCFLRKKFELPANCKVTRAILAIYAFNECEVRLNGSLLGTAEHWEAASHLDASKYLKQGMNLLAIRMRHGDPYLPAVIGKLLISFESGADMVLPLDRTWRISQNGGPAWDSADTDDTAWELAEELKGQPWSGPPPAADLDRVPAPYFRKEFVVASSLKRATVHVTALGVYELHINGKRVTPDVLAPGWTEFRKRVHYQTYDVGQLISEGNNCIGAILGDGWYASKLAHLGRKIYGGNPRFLAQLELEFADGSRQIVASDTTWKAAYGPIRHADLLMGCEYDARLAMPDWDKPGFDDRAWKTVDSSTKPGIVLQASMAEPSRVMEELPAIKMTEPKPGYYTFDLGQNMVGWVRLKVSGKPGERITVRHGEMLNADGTLYTASLRSCPATDFFILSGNGEEVMEPCFTFHGFRYVELRGLSAMPNLGAVTGLVVHTPMRRTGVFESSSPLLNKLYNNIIWGQKGNYLEVPTDCPQRDERMGWMGDAQFFAPTAAYNFDVAPFFTRWLQSCEDAQNPDGSFPNVVPSLCGGHGATGWSDAPLLCTYVLYRSYHDTRIVADRFAAMERYMKWLDGKTRDGISSVGGFGDWLNAGGGAKKEVMDTAYHAYLAKIMAEMAQAIGKDTEARQYMERHEKVKAAFVREFINNDGSIQKSSQTGYALAFTMGLIPDALKEKAAAKFADEIKKFDDHLATGFIGTPRLLPALAIAGRNDIACKLLLTETYPSWLFPVKNGATTMWERWNGWTPKKGFGPITMNSFNHYAFGAVGEYIYSGVGGIKAASPGYQEIIIAPAIEKGLTYARTSFNSIHGLIRCDWRKDGGDLLMDVQIPPNTTALVHVPAENPESVKEGDTPASKSEDVHFMSFENGIAIYRVDSGNYRFSSVLK